MTKTASLYSPQTLQGQGLGYVESETDSGLPVLWLWLADVKRHRVRKGDVLVFKGKHIKLIARHGAKGSQWRAFITEVIN